MDDEMGQTEKRDYLRKLFLPSLVASNFAAGPLAVLVSLLLVDIGNTFNVSVGVMGQINISYSIAAFIFALLMGILSLRFNHKLLLLAGLFFMCISALGCFLAWDFNMMLISYSLSGLGWAMISPMAVTLIGEHLPVARRAGAISWIVAGGALSYVIGPPMIATIAGFSGWRYTLASFVIPILLASLLLTFIGVPSASRSREPSASGKIYLRSFTDVLSNRSAVACLVGDALRSAAFVALLFYGASFVRQKFLMPAGFASIVILGAALCYTLGSLVTGPLVNKFGRKTLTVLTAFLAGIFTICYVSAPDLWFSVALILVASWFFGMVASAANNLTLEQVPRFRGTTMSLDTAALNVGSAFGTAMGGSMLLSFGYEGLGSVLGAIGIVAAFVFYLFAIDPASSAT